MAGLNLLPWRDKEREFKKKQFFVLVGFVMALAGVGVFLGHLYMQSSIEHQNQRNQFMKSEIAELDRQIEEIKRLDATRKALLSRMSVIEELQSTRPAIVHLFDEMAIALPRGMFLTEFEQSGTKLTVQGKAESNARVSTYMNSLDASPWLSSSNLNIISVEKSESERESNHSDSRLRDFKLDVKQLLKQSGGEG